MSGSPSQVPHAPVGARRKTTEACGPCRARKLKCDGLLPCQTCERSKAHCSYDPSTAAHRVTSGLDIINARVLELERAVFGERTYQPRFPTNSADTTPRSTLGQAGVDVFEDSTGSLSFYGPTSTFTILRSHDPHISRAANYDSDRERPQKRRRGAGYSPEDIYSSSDMTSTSGWTFQENLANKHIDCFFDKISDIIPVLNVPAFRSSYYSFLNPGNASPSESQIPRSRQRQCLIYSVLALGALYSETDRSGPEWAAKYFVKAQGLLGQLFGDNCLELVQATMFMATYAHRRANPNLAYNYLGIAIRMAYSIGINDNINSPEWPIIDRQEALRTWWTLYSLESDLCLEYGRPLSIRETDAKASYPLEHPDPNTEMASKVTIIVVMAKFARIARKIIDLASNISERTAALQSFVGRMMNLQAELMNWRAELPAHLAPKDNATVEGFQAWGQISWVQHQCCDIELRFNHVMLVMHRPFFAYASFSTPFYSSAMAKGVCIGAARETILLVHRVLEYPDNQWACYSHRVLAAMLVVITSIFDSSGEERTNLLELCSKSLEIFRCMRSGCPAKAAALVEDVLTRLSPGTWQAEAPVET